MTLVLTPAFVQQRRNPARVREMNLRFIQGEAVYFNPVIWNYDTDTAPVDVTAVVPMISLFRDRIGVGSRYWVDGTADYGWGYDFTENPILQYTGGLTASPGQFSFLFQPWDTAALGGRYRFYVFNSNQMTGFINGVTTYATGIIQVDGSPYAQPGLLGIVPPPQQAGNQGQGGNIILQDGTGNYFVGS